MKKFAAKISDFMFVMVVLAVMPIIVLVFGIHMMSMWISDKLKKTPPPGT